MLHARLKAERGPKSSGKLDPWSPPASENRKSCREAPEKSNISANIRKKSKSLLGLSTGARRSCLKKKTRGKKSGGTVTLRRWNVWAAFLSLNSIQIFEEAKWRNCRHLRYVRQCCRSALKKCGYGYGCRRRSRKKSQCSEILIPFFDTYR